MHDVGAPRQDFIRTGENVTVTIGRNRPNQDPGLEGKGPQVPMSDTQWQDFQSTTVETLRFQLQSSARFTYYGEGEWEGVTEESAVILFVDVQRTTLASTIDHMLRVLASQYGQDAIGWSFGAGRLATP